MSCTSPLGASCQPTPLTTPISPLFLRSQWIHGSMVCIGYFWPLVEPWSFPMPFYEAVPWQCFPPARLEETGRGHVQATLGSTVRRSQTWVLALCRLSFDKSDNTILSFPYPSPQHLENKLSLIGKMCHAVIRKSHGAIVMGSFPGIKSLLLVASFCLL